MSTGLPVITTNWSGQTEYVNEHNAVLIDPGELIQADVPLFNANLAQGKWADPSIEDTAEAMLKVFEDANLRDKIGKQAREDCVSKWTWGHAADDFLEALCQNQ